MPKRHRLFLSVTAAAFLASFASVPAQAAPERPLSDLTHEIVSFFGFGPDQANNPTDPQPVIDRQKAELTPREIAPVPVTALEAPPPMEERTPMAVLPFPPLTVPKSAATRLGESVPVP